MPIAHNVEIAVSQDEYRWVRQECQKVKYWSELGLTGPSHRLPRISGQAASHVVGSYHIT